MSNKEAEKRLKELFSAKEYLADPFLIFRLDELELPGRGDDAAPVLQVPRCIDALFTTDDPGQRELLEALVQWARRSEGVLVPSEVRAIADEVRVRYLRLRERGKIFPIDDVDDAQIASLLRDIFPVETDKVGLLGRMNRTLRTAVTTVLKVSRDTGRAIVSYGYELAELTKNRIAQLRIPERLDELVKAKQAFTERFYRFKGGKAVKVVLTIAVSMGGLATALTVAPVAGIALSASSLGLSLIDP